MSFPGQPREKSNRRDLSVCSPCFGGPLPSPSHCSSPSSFPMQLLPKKEQENIKKVKKTLRKRWLVLSCSPAHSEPVLSAPSSSMAAELSRCQKLCSHTGALRGKPGLGSGWVFVSLRTWFSWRSWHRFPAHHVSATACPRCSTHPVARCLIPVVLSAQIHHHFPP